MFKRLTVVAMMTAFALLVGACSDDDDKDVCQQYADAFKKCVDGLDCSTITDATKKMICEAMKNPQPAGDGGATQKCEGAVKDAAEKGLAAGFDDVCMPKTTPGDTGPTGDTTVDGGVTPDTGAGDQAMGDM